MQVLQGLGRKDRDSSAPMAPSPSMPVPRTCQQESFPWCREAQGDVCSSIPWGPISKTGTEMAETSYWGGTGALLKATASSLTRGVKWAPWAEAWTAVGSLIPIPSASVRSRQSLRSVYRQLKT